MAFTVLFPRRFAAGLEQTWRFDDRLKKRSPDYLDIQYSIIEKHEPLKEILRKHLQPGDLVLEAGCGDGRWMTFLNRTGYRSIGVDISSEIVAIMGEMAPQLKMLQGDVRALPLEDETVDAVLSSYVFEHFSPGPYGPLREAYRVLKPGGKLFFIVPFNSLLRKLLLNLLQKVAYYYSPRRRGRLQFVEYRFDRAECKSFLSACKFELLEMHADDCRGGWNKGVAVDYRNLKYYWGWLPSLPGDFQLPSWLEACVAVLRTISPWSCCGGIICVARKEGGK
jgi:ubiquinone/menaquinone biosynthesis C-methylase UbiE